MIVVPFRLDHRRLIRSQEHLEIVADAVAALTRSARLTVVHEVDGSCCHAEPWTETCDRLLSSLHERRQREVLYVRLGARG
jgi:hypothetical protein